MNVFQPFLKLYYLEDDDNDTGLTKRIYYVPHCMFWTLLECTFHVSRSLC